MHFAFTSGKPSPSYRCSNYIESTKAPGKYIFPYEPPRDTVYATKLFVFYLGDLCLVPQLRKLEDVDVADALQKVQVT